MNTAEYLLAALARRGTKRIYGVPGGGSSLDVIAAAERFGIRFILARHEGNAAMMAVADAEITGAPGVVLTTKGPGLMNALNGIACAALERAPVLLLTDGFTEKQLSYITHQVFDQRNVSAELVKGYTQARSDSPAAEIEALLDLAMQAPLGPVHLDLTSEAARRPAGELLALPAKSETPLDAGALAQARAMLAAARKPVILAGVEAMAAAEPLRALVAALGCPALVTYKAKGVIADADPHFVGIFTGGSLEAPCVQDADLIILAGLDPVELILQPWRYSAPVLDIGLRAHPVHYVTPTASLHGALAPCFTALVQGAKRSAWDGAVIAGHRDTMRAALTWQGSGGVAPPRIVTVQIPVDKIGELIGPKGKNIRGIQEETGAELTVDDDGTVTIAAVGAESMERARKMVEGMTAEAIVGETYEGTVKTVTAFGAFIEIMPGTEALLHVSEMKWERVEKPEDVVKKGDRVTVKLVDRDERGRLRLSMKALLPRPEGMPEETPGERPPRREDSGDRGGRSGGRSGGGGRDRR